MLKFDLKIKLKTVFKKMSRDISKFRKPNDTEIEWKYKKLFIETYIDKFNEARLICLAQCYVNHERLGCR